MGGGGVGGGDFCYVASDAEANPGEQPARGEATVRRCTLVEQRIFVCVCVPWAASSSRFAHEGVSESKSLGLRRVRLARVGVLSERVSL